jgi:four helix bundle protein
VHDHRRLKVWQAGRRFVFDVYELTLGFPDSERFGLTSQLRRASVSIPSNIAEGAGRGGSGRSFAHFLRIAAGSAAEAATLLPHVELLVIVHDTQLPLLDVRGNLSDQHLAAHTNDRRPYRPSTTDDQSLAPYTFALLGCNAIPRLGLRERAPS